MECTLAQYVRTYCNRSGHVIVIDFVLSRWMRLEGLELEGGTRALQQTSEARP